MGNTIIGNGSKKYAELYVKGNFIARIVYYYWSEGNGFLRLHDKNKYIIAQIDRNKVVVLLEDEEYKEPYLEEE